MSSLKEKIELREQGLTYTQIADKLGISPQAVSQALAKYDPKYFQFIGEEKCIYKGLRDWMNRNKVSVAELTRRMGKMPYSESTTRMRMYLSGKIDFKKRDVDKILEITGLTYEIVFDTTYAADVAAVVRCKDCKNWDEGTGWCKEHSCFVDARGEFCHPWESANWKMFDDNDFCSYGERKEQ